MKRRFSFRYPHMVKSCWDYSAPMRSRMVLIYTLTICATLVHLAQPFVMGRLINALQQGGPSLLRQSMLWLAIYGALTLGSWMFHGPSRLVERNLAFHIKKNFLAKYYTILTQLPVYWHHDHHSGAIVNRVNKASQGLYGFADLQFIFTDGIVGMLGAFVMLALIATRIALIEVVFAALIFFVLVRYDRVLFRLQHERNEREHDYASALFDYIGNITNIVSLNLGEPTRQRLGDVLSKVKAPLKREIVINEFKWFTTIALMVLAQLIVMYFYIRGQLQSAAPLKLGNLVAIFQYMNNLNMVFLSFANNYERLIQQHTDLTAVEPLQDAYALIGIRDAGKPELRVTAAQIHFDHLHFIYNAGAQVFDGFDLRIGGSEKIGLVGRSGAGKTTLVNLLLRFFELGENRIAIDGQDIRDVTHESLRRNIAVIPQDTSLFEASLMENIRFGRLDASDEEVMAAARKAHAHDFIASLPEGYDSLVGERGVKLSGGQRQRIAIARAILKDAPILVLDEATSALDSESEKYIQESLSHLMQGKTVIAIAHRLSTIAHLDRLVVLDKGRIVEEGSHAALLAQGGHYAGLWAMQSGGFLTD